MTLVTAALDRCARECSTATPDNWASATDEDQVAIRDDFLLETVNNILDRATAPSPVGAQVAVTGADTYVSGSGYALPSAYRRLQRDKLAVYETTPSRRACTPITDDGQWTHIQEVGLAGTSRFFKLNGFEGNWYIDFYQTLQNTSDSVTVSYVTNNWMQSSGGTDGSAFTDVGDVLLLPRLLVEAGIVYRFRRRNGLQYQDVQRDYEMHLARYSNDRRVRRVVAMGATPKVMAPWDIPVPDYIPET